jgi:hypothetical protein
VGLFLSLIDELIYILLGLLVLYFQFSKRLKKLNVKFFKNKTYAIIISSIFIVGGLATIPREIINYQKSQIPLHDMVHAMSDSSQTAADDFFHKSRLGFQLLIPRGYHYSLIDNNLLSVMLRKEKGLIAVTTANENKNLTKFSDEVCESMRQRNSTITFKKISNDHDKIILETDMINFEGENRHGYLVFIQKYGRTHNMILSYPKNDSLIYEEDFQRVINSFDNQ